jgi:histidine transport system permease protein
MRCRESATTGRLSSRRRRWSLLGLEDVVKATQLAGKSTWQPFYFAIVCGLIYLVFTTVSNGVLLLLERRYSVGVKRADL